MDIINLYFGKIVFSKIDLREEHAIYVAALSSSYQDGRKQYAMAFVPNHLAVLTRAYLSDLSWVNLQTRTMTNGYKMPPQRWEIPKGLPTPMFSLVERTENKSKYISDELPLEMVLIHDPKKKSKYQYHNHMNLLAALVTFKCVISLRDIPASHPRDLRQHYAPEPVHYSSLPPQHPLANPSQYQPPRSSPSQYQPPRENYGVPQLQPQKMTQSYTSQTPLSNMQSYGSETSYTPKAPSGPYATIGLPEYGIPQTPPSQPPPQRQSVAAVRNNNSADPSIEFL